MVERISFSFNKEKFKTLEDKSKLINNSLYNKIIYVKTHKIKEAEY